MLFKKRVEGSITLEASLILPLFIAFLLLLITMIKVATVEIALNNAVSQATKQIATHMYPVNLLYGKFMETSTGQAINEGKDQAVQVYEEYTSFKLLLEEYSFLFPTGVEALITATDQIEQKVSNGYDKTLGMAFQPIVDYYADKTLINLEALQITRVMLPSFTDMDKAYFGLEVRYDLPLNLPFIDKTMVFKQNAYERVWIGDSPISINIPNSPASESQNPSNPDSTTNSSNDSSIDNEDEQPTLYIDSITNPAQKGRPIKIIAKGPPNQLGIVKLYYQSGFTKEENFYFDQSGWLSGSIKIGGRANEGSYKAVLTVAGQEASISFEVLSKANMDKYRNARMGVLK